MNGERGLKITFTELLYAVVIGSAFTQFDSPVFSIENVFLCIAIIAIMDDYLLYHFDIEDIENTRQNYVLCFAIDAVVLVAWYGSVLAAKSDATFFFLGLGIFYVTTSIWRIALDQAWSVKDLSQTDLPLAVVWCALAALGETIPWWSAAILGLLAFITLRLSKWRAVWKG